MARPFAKVVKCIEASLFDPRNWVMGMSDDKTQLWHKACSQGTTLTKELANYGTIR